ncbi:FG-GAP-like repeat-containing protein [Stieleria sp. TO1_6]|uniref:FG-GAP-like repeat-containing protein n=1 Tax=Stieleria tagensis TaxID=2956795 RepID=UPI00209B6795|nr:FG-GAP-like repeat-containing protein [Stieleria tagensis]MCO8124651.1 FG-GAP-like repeat-containing protein [Stieleria tagensis]
MTQSLSIRVPLVLLAVLLLIVSGCRRPDAASQSAATSSATASKGQTPAATTKTGSLQDVNTLARAGHLVAAEQLVSQLTRSDPDDGQTWETAADVAVARGQRDEAIRRYQTAVGLSDPPATKLLDKLARQWLAVGKPFQAVDTLQQMVRIDPDDETTRRDLAGLLASLGLERRAAEHLQYLIQRGQAGAKELIILTDLTRPQTDVAICEFALAENPSDLRPLYALARVAAYEGRWDEAINDLRRVWKSHPDFLESSAYYGRAIVEVNAGDRQADPALADSELAAWFDTVPAAVRSQPQYWMALGIWANSGDDPAAATRAFWQAAQLDQNNGEALLRLSTGLAQLDRAQASQSAAGRAALIAGMRDDVESFFFWRNHSQRAAVKIAKSMQKLGRLWEAASWARIAVMMTQDPDDSALTVFQDIRKQLNGRTPWQLSDHRVTDGIDIDDLPEIVSLDRDTINGDTPANASAGIRFADQAAERGLDHVCKIAAPAEGESGLWIYQSGAGGAGVIDFDLDGWPDLYLSQCDGSPQQTDSSTNRLFRNLGGQFHDCTDPANALDDGYTQGIAVGDINSDGLPDIYIGNFGRNQLLQNNGDGTFREIMLGSTPQPADWTTSVGIADLDADGLADLFDVQYVGGDDVLTRKCFADNQSTHRSCGPLVFPAAADRVWQGRPDGSFVDQSTAWLGGGASQPEAGRGLGLVIGNFDQRRGLDVYVSNDMSANHYWSTDQQSDSFQLVEQAAARGVALDQRSLSQASMGIAADDADGDGDVDFYVTHFTDEYNTLYAQIADGIWADRTQAVGLAAPTLSMLGYGTQWIDANGDGTLELVVANGNVDDFSTSGHAYRMPMQLFRRQPDRRYAPVPAETLGAAFQTPRLGRALVTLDADRDRRLDVLVTHLFDPVSLLINQTPAAPSKQTVTAELVGTTVHRDAIGATVSLEFGNHTVTKQLIAGDGFQCSKQRRLWFAVDPSAGPIRAIVRWGDGSEQVFEGIEPGNDYLFVQGVQRLSFR